MRYTGAERESGQDVSRLQLRPATRSLGLLTPIRWVGGWDFVPMLSVNGTLRTLADWGGGYGAHAMTPSIEN